MAKNMVKKTQDKQPKGSVATSPERIAEIRILAQKIGAAYGGQVDITDISHPRYLLKMSGRAGRWITYSHLKADRNPFSIRNEEECLWDLSAFEKEFDCKWNGQKRGGDKASNIEILVVRKDKIYEPRWVSICHLNKLENPWFHLTAIEGAAILKRLTKHIKGCVVTGKRKRIVKDKRSRIFYELTMQGREARWVTPNQFEQTPTSNPFSILTRSEMIARLKAHAKKNQWGITGKVKIRGRTALEVTKKGFENRWIDHTHLLNNQDAFFKLTKKETDVALTGFMRKLGATNLHKQKRVGRGIIHYGASKKGLEDRYLPFSSWKSGIDPWILPTKSELIARFLAAFKRQKYGYFAGKIKKMNGQNYFLVKRKGYDDRWVDISQVKRTVDIYRACTMPEQIRFAKQYAKAIDLTATGRHRQKVCKDGSKTKTYNEFEVLKKGYAKSRWTALSSLKNRCSPFRVKNLKEQIVELKKVLNSRFPNDRIKFTGKTKRICNGRFNGFELSMPGRENRFLGLADVKTCVHPFYFYTSTEIDRILHAYAKTKNCTYTGKNNGKIGNQRKYEFAKKHCENRWATFALVNSNCDPFFKQSVNEQITELKALIKPFGGVYLNKHRNKKGYRQFLIAKNGETPLWVMLSNLRSGKNPFANTGFDSTRVGYLYALLVALGKKKYIKFGITNNKFTRYRDHTRHLKGIGATFEEIDCVRFKSGAKCQSVETELIRLFKPFNENLGALGFQDESFVYGIKTELLEKLQVYKQNP